MDKKQLNQIVSMIIQNLRLSKHAKIIDLIKKSEYVMERGDQDSWNGGFDFYSLIFHLNFTDYSKIYDDKDTYENIIQRALKSFYGDESDFISVTFKAKIEQFVDWEALEATENKHTILTKLEKEKEILIKVGTGIEKIQDINEQYKVEHQKLCSLLKTICLTNPNTYDDLWNWYDDYKEKGLSTYQNRRTYLKSLYAEIISTIENSKLQNNTLYNYIPIGWEKVDNSISRMKKILINASITEDYQSVGMYGREV